MKDAKARAVTGDRHLINYEAGIQDGMTKIRATCICGSLDSPPRARRERAEEDGHDHLFRHSTATRMH